MTAPVIGFAGMTHLGLVSAAAAAGRGFRVVGYDADASLTSRLGRGELPVLEPGLPELIGDNRDRLTFTAELMDLSRCDLVYIAADVATGDSGQSDLAPIRALIAAVASALAPTTCLVILSQVPPGFTRSLGQAPARLFYQVETLIFGRAVERATRPERFIIGCADPAAALPRTYANFLGAFACPVLPMRYESAELAKIAINACLVAAISTANTLAELCEKIGADWSEIVPALKLDRRIGEHAYLAPGLGLAGGNLERDLATIMHLARVHATDDRVVQAWIANSRHRRDWAARTIRQVLLSANPAAVLAVWGLAYKENTHSVKNSPALATLAQLADIAVRLHDPVVPATAVAHPKAQGCADKLVALHGADALMILTPWPEYRAARPAAIAKAMKGRILLDPYAVLDGKASLAAGLDYYTLGRPPILAG